MTIRYGGAGVRVVGDGLVLREWERGDLAAMVELFDVPDVAFRTPLAAPFDLTAAEAYLELAQTDNGRIQLAITTDGERPLGEVLLNQATGSMGYVLGPAYRGKGLAARSLKLLTDYAHEVAGLSRVYLEIEPDNQPSAGVARRSGFHLTDLPLNVVTDKGREVPLQTWEHLS